MPTHTAYLWFETKKRQEIIDITDEVAAAVKTSGVHEGFVLVSAMHISASVFVNDHESGLWKDILHWLEHTVAPWDPRRYKHNDTGGQRRRASLEPDPGARGDRPHHRGKARLRPVAACVLRRVGWPAEEAGGDQGDWRGRRADRRTGRLTDRRTD